MAQRLKDQAKGFLLNDYICEVAKLNLKINFQFIQTEFNYM